MKAKLLSIVALVIVLVSIIVACNKNKFQTRPSLEFKEVNNDTLSQGNLLRFTLEFTDKEGDVTDSIWIQRVSKVCPTSFPNPIRYAIPSTFIGSKNIKADFQINYRYNVINADYPPIGGCPNKVDTSVFRFWVRDKAGNVSDTVSSPNIVFLR